MSQTFRPLAGLMAAGRAAGCPTAVHEGRMRCWDEFAARVAGLARRLDGRRPARWALLAEDGWAFAVGLLGIWHAGGVAVIPPNGQPGTLRSLGGDVRGLVTDGAPADCGVETIGALDHAAPGEGWRPLDAERPCLALYTSGTAGERHVEVKSIGHIDAEVAGHERRWGALVGGARALGTVPCQHIYGLLFRIAWPLAAGRPFDGEAFLQPADLIAAIERADAGYLVATPTYLRRLKDAAGLARVRGRCRAVFSSGGPLDATTAHALAALLGQPPIEVFGSTETGGVGWRRQAPGGGPAWRPFDGVAVTADGDEARLRVRSPWVSRPGGETVLGDGVEILPDGTFLTGPRADRVVKIGEQRLVLAEMEQRLREHPWVSAVALVVLDQRGDARTGAVVVLSEAGRAAIGGLGRHAGSRALADWLAQHWNRVLLPRHWRFVERLPEDLMGKVSAAALRETFAPRPDAMTDPEVLAESVEGDRCVRTLRVPAGLGCFAGHFPAMPVVPGFVQLQWALDAAAAVGGGPVALHRLEAVKFRDLVRPGDVLELTIERSKDAVQFVFARAGAPVSSGRVVTVS